MSEEERCELLRQAEKKKRIIYLFHTERLYDILRQEETVRMFEETIDAWNNRQKRLAEQEDDE